MRPFLNHTEADEVLLKSFQGWNFNHFEADEAATQTMPKADKSVP